MNEQELINEAYEAANGGFKIPDKWYPDVSKWEDTSITEFFKTSYPDGAPTKGYIQQLQDINKMEQDERKHDWKGQWERKLKQDKFNAEHPSKPLPKKAPPKISKRSWLTKRLPEVEYVSMNNHLNDTVGDSQAYAWSSSNTSVATVSGGTTNTTTATGKAAGKANIIAKLTTTDSEGKTGTSQGQATLTVTAAPAEKAHAKTGSVSLSNSAATVGTSFSSNVSLSNLVDADDGSYVYYWSFSGTYSGLSFSNTASPTPVISGTPTAAGTASVRCSVKDSYGNYATITAGTITINAAADKAHLTQWGMNTKTQSAKMNSSNTITYTFNNTAHDDGSYVYNLHWSGSSPYKSASGTQDAVPVTWNGTDAQIILTGQIIHGAGSYFIVGTITDSYNKTVTLPSQAITLTVS